MPSKRKSAWLRRTIPSSLESADCLCVGIRHFILKAGLEEVCFPVELLARECLSNAVIHGNRRAVDKSIDLTVSVGTKWIRLKVADGGTGFAWRRAGKRGLDARATSGRGLQICGLYADRIRFNRPGNIIELWIKKSKPNEGNLRMAAHELQWQGEELSITLDGDLTAAIVPDLQADLKSRVHEGARKLVFNLSNAAMLDSSGIGLLIASANSVSRSGGEVRVTNVSPEIFRLLQNMRLVARLNVSARTE